MELLWLQTIKSFLLVMLNGLTFNVILISFNMPLIGNLYVLGIGSCSVFS